MVDEVEDVCEDRREAESVKTGFSSRVIALRLQPQTSGYTSDDEELIEEEGSNSVSCEKMRAIETATI
jgi:hypothetical protein